MNITISTDTHYKESTRKGIGHEIKAPPKLAAKWRKVLKEYDAIQKEMAAAYNIASNALYDSFKAACGK